MGKDKKKQMSASFQDLKIIKKWQKLPPIIQVLINSNIYCNFVWLLLSHFHGIPVQYPVHFFLIGVFFYYVCV